MGYQCIFEVQLAKYLQLCLPVLSSFVNIVPEARRYEDVVWIVMLDG